MALFQKIKTPFIENPPEGEKPAASGPRSAGDVLRQQREGFGLTIEEVAAALRIKPAYLRALEEGRPEGLPGSAYAVGFARSYSNFLGLDTAEVLRRLKAERAELGLKPDLSFPIPLGERSLPSGSMLLVALILAVIGYGGWYYLSNRAHLGAERVGAVPASLLSKPKPSPETAKKVGASPTAAPKSSVQAGGPASAPAEAPAPRLVPGGLLLPPAEKSSVKGSPPSVAATPPAAPASAAEGSPAPGTSPSSATPEAAPAAKISAASLPRVFGAKTSRIVIRASALSWVEVRAADRSILFERVLKPGESYRVPDKPGVTLRTGNAGGLSIAVDGKRAPPLGGVGGVLRHVLLDPQALLAGKAAGG